MILFLDSIFKLKSLSCLNTIYLVQNLLNAHKYHPGTVRVLQTDDHQDTHFHGLVETRPHIGQIKCHMCKLM